MEGWRADTMDKTPLIDIQHVTYTYPFNRPLTDGVTPVFALQNIRLQIPEGEYVALLGHNGSGKSTLARLCNALLVPDKGQVLVDGIDSRDITKQQYIREQIGIVFQNPDNQIIATVVEDDVAWSLALSGIPVHEIQERVDEALAAVHLEAMRYSLPHQLSGGQRQRLALAGLLALRPRCIIADEATSMLDPFSRQEIVNLLYQLQREHGLTILHVTHLLEEIISAQRIVIMAGGQIVREGSPAEILADLDLLRELKLSIPDPLLLAERLRLAGFAISPRAVALEELAWEIANA